MDQWVSNLEIGVDFVNKEDADLLILIGVCWVQNYGFDFRVRFLVSILDCRFVDVDYCLI